MSELILKPKVSCKRCQGRGHMGRNVTTGRYILCHCLVRRANSNPLYDYEVEYCEDESCFIIYSKPKEKVTISATELDQIMTEAPNENK